MNPALVNAKHAIVLIKSGRSSLGLEAESSGTCRTPSSRLKIVNSTAVPTASPINPAGTITRAKLAYAMGAELAMTMFCGLPTTVPVDGSIRLVGREHTGRDHQDRSGQCGRGAVEPDETRAPGADQRVSSGKNAERANLIHHAGYSVLSIVPELARDAEWKKCRIPVATGDEEPSILALFPVSRRIAVPFRSRLAISITSAHFSTLFNWAPIGSRRIRLPVAAKMALQSAGANGGTPTSPIPPGGASLSAM
jgi:hypothetical protein